MGVMGWVRRVFARGATDPSPTSDRVYISPRTRAGVFIDEDQALRNATVFACVQYLSRTVAQLPWHVMRPLPAGGADVMSSSPADYLLYQRPNSEMGSFTWRQTMMSAAILYGNGYAEIQWDNRGAPYALWPIHPTRVTPRRRAVTGELYYEVWNSSGAVELDAADMFHVRGFGEGPVGKSVIEYAAESIGWAQATQLFGSTFFGEGMNPSGIIEQQPNIKLSPGALKELLAAMKRLYAGPRGERTMVLDAGMTFKKLATNPDEAQFIETRQHQIDEICRWFGVPPHKVQNLLRATFSNIEHQSIEVVVDSVTPWVKVFEEEANYKFFGLNRQGLYTKMNMKGLLRGDNVSRSQFYKTMNELGMSMNDILAAEDMNGIGPDGDVRFVSNNVQTLDRAIRGEPTPRAQNPDEAQPGVIPTDGATNGIWLPH